MAEYSIVKWLKGTEYTELFPTQIKKVNCTIPVSAWASSKRINFIVNGVVADEDAQFIKINIDAESYAEWVSCGLLCIGQSTNTLRISCSDRPKNPMNFVVTIIPLKQGVTWSDDSGYQFKTKLKEKQTNGDYAIYEPLILASELITLSANTWVNQEGTTGTYTFGNSKYASDSESVFIYPVPLFVSLSEYISCNIECTVVGTTLVFSCDIIPENDLQLYMVYGGTT